MNGKQLKNSILQWAIQGKLVPQDPNDEPASVLLEHIRAEKARLIKEGKIKKDKNETIIFRGDDNSHYEKLPNGEVRCIDDEIPFEIPDSWEWVRVKMLGDIITGSTPPTEKKELYGSDYPFFKPTDLGQGLYTINSKDSVSILGFENSRKVTSGSVLITCIGATIGKTGLVRKDGICNQQINAIIPLPYFSYEYIYFACISSTFQEQIKRNASSTTLPILNKQKFETLLLPIPPFSEQQNIVAKLKEILPIIENYNTVQVKLDTLNGEINNLLKKSILQEAIQGRLVEQCEADEPATELLKRIQQEKQKLVKEGKLKAKDITDSIIYKGDDNKYYEQIGGKAIELDSDFEFPNTWSVVRLSDICRLIDGEKKQGQYVCLDAKYLRGKSTGDKLNNGKFVSKGDNIILVDGENSGEVFTVPCDGYMGSTFKQLWVSREMYLPYVLYFIQFYKDRLRNSKKGAAIPHLNKDIFYNLLIGIPPCEEQIQISKKIYNLYRSL